MVAASPAMMRRLECRQPCPRAFSRPRPPHALPPAARRRARRAAGRPRSAAAVPANSRHACGRHRAGCARTRTIGAGPGDALLGADLVADDDVAAIAHAPAAVMAAGKSPVPPSKKTDASSYPPASSQARPGGSHGRRRRRWRHRNSHQPAAAGCADSPRTTGRPRPSHGGRSGSRAHAMSGSASSAATSRASVSGVANSASLSSPAMTRPCPSAVPRLRPPATPNCVPARPVSHLSVPPQRRQASFQVLRPRPLVHHEDVPRYAGLSQSGPDRRDGVLGAIQRQDHHVGVI